MNDHDIQLLHKAGFTDVASALSAIDSMSDEMRSLHRELEHLESQYGYVMSERDEARRIVCQQEAKRLNGMEDPLPLTPKEVAKMIYAWDCFDHPSTTVD